MEAMAFAWLAWRCQQLRSAHPPAVTGASGDRILGAIYPARDHAGTVTDGKRRAATTGGAGVGVVDNEARALQPFLVVHLGARQILEAHGINHQPDAVPLDDGIVLGQFVIEGEAVLETGASPTGDEHPQTQAIIALFLDQRADLGHRTVAE